MGAKPTRSVDKLDSGFRPKMIANNELNIPIDNQKATVVEDCELQSNNSTYRL